MPTLTPLHVRRILLAGQGLASEHPAKPGPADVLAAIRRMHALQIDTISVVNRSPYFVLWSRLGQYDPKWLEQLHEDGALFEYWAHAACFIPIEDYPLYVDRMRVRGLKRREYVA
ncbi:MAG: crosslink repair DNA glycosylase YcaQ family protein, partial [Dehalococcoidia bacterium]